MRLTTIRILAFLLAALTLTATACQTNPPAETPTDSVEDTTENRTDNQETDPQEEPMKPSREIYEDLSFNVPAYVRPEDADVTVTSEGDRTTSDVILDFSKNGGEYLLSSTRIPNAHDSASECDTCGYTRTADGEEAFLLCSHGGDMGAVTVTLATPLPVSAVTGMTATLKTTANATSSQIRILTATETNNAAFINTCESMADAVEDWKTLDLGISDYSKLADGDGYIRTFQLVFRNKNRCDCYLKSVSISVSPTDYLNVTEIRGSFLFDREAAQAIAEVIAERFSNSGLCAEIKVETSRYRRNSSKSEGAINYAATATLSDGTVLTGKGTVTIPAISGEWLDTTDGSYGSSHDSKGQWQESFDPSGMVLLTDNVITCAEGVSAVEYAVIPADGAYDDPTLLWYAPQILEMGEDGFAKLFVNAYTDYGDALAEGEKYRFLIRGVSKNNNYVLHLDIPFTFSNLSEEAVAALRAAREALGKVSLTVTADTADKAAAVTEKLNTLVDNGAVTVHTTVLGEGVNSMRVTASLTYNTPVTAPRLPAYELDGEALTAVYAFGGAAFTVADMTVPYGELNPEILLLAPYDGERGIILASEEIYKHALAPLADIQSEHYGYKAGEFCTPAPAVLKWNAEEGAVYTVTVSESLDLSDPVRVLTVSGGEAEIYNLKVGQQYYWQVSAGGKVSPVFTFITADGYPRFLKVDGISNFRDLGGYITLDGRRVKQGLAFRSAHLDAVTAAGKAIAIDELGIKTDLDVRGGGSAPLGAGVKHISIGMQWYNHIFNEKNYEVVRKTISTFAYEENYPLVFHCSMGRDRTGTTAYLILGLLGVDDDTLLHEYYASYFSDQGRFDVNEFPLMIINIREMRNGLMNFGGSDATTQERIEAYLLHIGVTESEIASIRAILLEN